jgi:hypothetical protein
LRLEWAEWINGLFAGTVVAVATAGANSVGGWVFGSPLDWRALGGGLLVTTVGSGLLYIATHRPPNLISVTTTTVTKDPDTGVVKAVVVQETPPPVWDGVERRSQQPPPAVP